MGVKIFLSVYFVTVGFISRGVFLKYYKENLLYALWRFLFAIIVAPLAISLAIAELQRKGRFNDLAEAFKKDCKSWREKHNNEEG